MNKRLRKLALTIPQEGSLVERSAPGEAPSAFRIWAGGENACDDESVFFTPKSAELLIAEQGERGRVYAFDFDHLSLSSDRPATSGRAAGWHSLEVRTDASGQPELWAINIEWCADAKAGLEAQPPHWRFYSPAFFTNAANEIVSYVNCALCVNPLTHQLPSLMNLRAAAVTASTGEVIMDKKALMAALAILASSESSEDDKKEAAAQLAAHFDAEDGDDKKDDEDKPVVDAQDGEDEDDKKDEEERSAKAASASVKLAKENQKLKARLDAIEIRGLLDARADLAPAVRTWAASQPLAVVKSFVAQTPVAVDRPASITQGGTESSEDATDEHEVDVAMGMRRKSAGPIGIGAAVNGLRLINTASPAEAFAALAAKKGA